jgi:hypothetical protein
LDPPHRSSGSMIANPMMTAAILATEKAPNPNNN